VTKASNDVHTAQAVVCESHSGR